MAFFGSQLPSNRPAMGMEIEAPLSEAFGAVYDIAQMENPTEIMNRMSAHTELDYTPIGAQEYKQRLAEGDPNVSYRENQGFVERKVNISFEEAQAMAVERGIDADRLPKPTITKGGRQTRRGVRDREQIEVLHSKDYWNSILDVLEEKTERERIIARADKGPAFYAGALPVGLAAFAQDPINVATVMFPVLGASSRVKAVSQISSTAGRVGARAGIGFAEGAVGAAAFEPIYYNLIRQEDLDYDMTNSLVNIAISGAFGAIVNPIVSPSIEKAFISKQVDKVLESVADTAEEVRIKAKARDDLYFRQVEVPQLKTAVANSILQADRGTLEVVMRAAVNQLMDGKPIDVLNILVSDLRVSNAMDRIRGTSNEQILRDVIGEALQIDESVKLTKAQRSKVAAEMNDIQAKLEEAAQIRQELKKQSKTLSNADTLKLIKEDARIKKVSDELQARLDVLKNKLGKSKAAKESQAKINQMQQQIESGEFFETALATTERTMKALNQVAPDRSSLTLNRGTDKVLKKIDEKQVKVESVQNKPDDALVDAEAEELQKILDSEADEASMDAMKEQSSKIDEQAKVFMDAIEEFKACRIS